MTASRAAAVHGLRPEEVAAILELFETLGRYRSLASQARAPWQLHRQTVWVSPATVRRVLAAHGLGSEAPPAGPLRAQAVPGVGGLPPQLDLDLRLHAFRWLPEDAVFAVMDLVTRKWISELVSIEETSTQVQVVFIDALELEGLLELVEARQDATAADPFPQVPTLTCSRRCCSPSATTGRR